MAVLFGLGNSLSLYSGILLLHEIFDKRRGLALGIGSTGAGIGTLLWGLAIPHLEQKLGLVGLLQALGGLVLASICSAALLLNKPCSHANRKPNPGETSSPAVMAWRAFDSAGMRLTCAGVVATSFGLCEFHPFMLYKHRPLCWHSFSRHP